MSTMRVTTLKNESSTVDQIVLNADGSFGGELASTLGSKLNIAGGKILQTVAGSTQTQTQVASTSYTDSGLTATIIPTSATSKVLVVVSQQILILTQSSNERLGGAQLVRGSTTLFTDARAVNMNVAPGSNTFAVIGTTYSFAYLDTPATTSSTTYKMQIRINTTDNGSLLRAQNNGESTSTMILMEVSA
jgi:hypothetical protein